MGSAGENQLQVDDYATLIVPLTKVCPWLVSSQMIQYQEEIDLASSGVSTRDSGIRNEVEGMPDTWYWRDKPLHRNTIKVG